MRRWMPSSPGPLWLSTGLLLAAFPILNFVYWPEVLKSGVLRAESDSIIIPMFGSVILTLMVSPVVLLVAWLCLRRYNPETRIDALRHDRPYRSAAATLAFGGVAAALTIGAVRAAAAVQPWYEYLWPAYVALWVPWLLALRAAWIEQESVTDHFARSGS